MGNQITYNPQTFKSSSIVMGLSAGLSAVQGLTVYGDISSRDNLYVSGKIGVGTSTPTGINTVLSAHGKSVHIYNNTNDGTSQNSNTVFLAESVNRNAYMIAAVGPAGYGGVSVLKSSDSSHMGRFIADYHNDLIFQNGPLLYESMRILSGGNVGIGTSTPSERLSIDGNISFVGTSAHYIQSPYFSDKTMLVFGGANTNGSSAVHPFYSLKTRDDAILNTDSAIDTIATSSNRTIVYGPENVTRYYLVSGTPANPLPVSSGTPIACLRGFAYSGSNKFITLGGGGNASIDIRTQGDQSTVNGGGYIGFYTMPMNSGPAVGGPERMRITAEGNVGIGTDIPAQLLHVYKSNPSSYTRIKVENPSSSVASQAGYEMTTGSANCFATFIVADSATPYSEWRCGTGVTGGMYITSGATNAPIVFRQSVGAERARFDYYGNLGLGTDSPGAKLHVLGGANTMLIESAAQETVIDFKNTSTTGRQWRVGTGGSAGGLADGKFGIFDVTGGTIRYWIDINGSSTTYAENATIALFKSTVPDVNGFVGIRVDNSTAYNSGSQLKSFYDFSNGSVNVANMHADMLTTGATDLYFSTTPAGSRTSDRREERLRIGGDGSFAFYSKANKAHAYLTYDTGLGGPQFQLAGEYTAYIDLAPTIGNGGSGSLSDFGLRIACNGAYTGNLGLNNASVINSNQVPLILATNDTLRMRVDTTDKTTVYGQLKVQITGMNEPNKPTDWGGGVTTFDLYCDEGTIGVGTGVGTAAQVLRAFMDKNGTIMGKSLSGTGNRAVYSDINGYLTNTSSDCTLKTSISSISQGLDEVLLLEPKSFNWKDVEKFGSQREIGFIAQEVEPIIPEVIGTNADGTLSLDYPKMVAVLTKAIQELNAKVDAQAVEIAALKKPQK